MLDVFLSTFSTVASMLLCIVAGFLLSKTKLFPENTHTVISKLETYLLVPALSIGTFAKNCTFAALTEHWLIVVYAAAAAVIAILIATPLSKLFVKEGYQRNIYKYALAFGNFGFAGTAIILALFGSETLYQYMLFTTPLQIFVMSWGLSQLVPDKKEKTGFFRKLINPSFISVLIGIVIGVLDLKRFIPDAFFTAAENFGACMTPMAMLLTGFVIGGYRVSALLTIKKVYVATLLRLTVLPAVLLFILHLLGASPLYLTLAFMAFAAPLGLNTVVFPAAYGGDPKTGAAMAMISHVLCVISIPLMYVLFTAVTG